jgi:pSer/pThr/pTyr-binding forkhead associated (FHA) protein
MVKPTFPPAMPRVIITAPDKTPQPYRFELDHRTVTLGRHDDNDIVIDCSSVSSKHAEMVRVEGGYELRDLNSTNGTKLNGERRMVVPLSNGAEVTLGDTIFDFELSNDELAILLAEGPDNGTAPLTEASVAKGRSSTVMFILFIVLAAAAFAIGMELSHRKKTGQSLWQNLGKTTPAKIEVPHPGVTTPEDAAAEKKVLAEEPAK